MGEVIRPGDEAPPTEGVAETPRPVAEEPGEAGEAETPIRIVPGNVGSLDDVPSDAEGVPVAEEEGGGRVGRAGRA